MFGGLSGTTNTAAPATTGFGTWHARTTMFLVLQAVLQVRSEHPPTMLRPAGAAYLVPPNLQPGSVDLVLQEQRRPLEPGLVPLVRARALLQQPVIICLVRSQTTLPQVRLEGRDCLGLSPLLDSALLLVVS
jgi:hypothetical protein